MKKILLPFFFLFTAIAAFAQDDEQNSAAYKFGEKYAIPIILVVVLIIGLIIWAIVRKKKTPPPPPPPTH